MSPFPNHPHYFQSVRAPGALSSDLLSLQLEKLSPEKSKGAESRFPFNFALTPDLQNDTEHVYLPHQITPFLRNSSEEITLSTGNALGTKMFITALFQLKVPEEGTG